MGNDGAVRQPNLGEQLPGAGCRSRRARSHRNQNVLEGRERRDEMEGLEDESIFSPRNRAS